MNLKNIYKTLQLAALALVVAACSQDELDVPGGAASGGEAITISITDGGYADVTRATESGYKTIFTPDDACGLYIVRNNEVIKPNIKLTAQQAEGTDRLTWKASDPLYYTPQDKYFIYYPYKEDMSEEVDASGSDDEDFFKQLIDNWKPDTDQSSYADYTASDLMTATGSVGRKNENGKRTLTFSMTHRMAMAVIEMPKTVYQFTNKTGGKIPDYTVATSADFGENKPYSPASGIYRYIVRPSAQQDAPTLIGSYADGKKEFTITPTDIAENSYKTYKVNGAREEKEEYELKIGDFLMKDGTLLPFKEGEPLSVKQQANVAAIIFWTPAETDPNGRQTPASLTDDQIMAHDFPKCTHGLAVSLRDVGTMAWQESFESVQWFQDSNNFTHDNKDLFVPVASNTGPNDAINKILGYQNTQVLLAYNAYCSKANIVQPVAALAEFAENNRAPSVSTGWFLPSVKELHMLCNEDVDNVYREYGYTTRDNVNKSLSSAGGNQLENVYWSSSEDVDSSYYAFFVNFGNANVNSVNKDNSLRVRVVCAF